MTVARLFEEFGADRAEAAPAPDEMTEALEDEKLKSFEEGYGAGWEDAIKAQAEGERLLFDAMRKSLEETHLTCDDVLQTYMRALHPVLAEMALKVLPTIAAQTLADHVVAALQDLARDAAELPVRIVVSPDQERILAKRMAVLQGLEAKLVADPHMGPGQAALRLGETEKLIDLDDVVAGISDAIDAFHGAELE